MVAKAETRWIGFLADVRMTQPLAKSLANVAAAQPVEGGRRRKAATRRKKVAALGFAPLRTERLTLRPIEPSDASALHRLW